MDAKGIRRRRCKELLDDIKEKWEIEKEREEFAVVEARDLS